MSFIGKIVGAVIGLLVIRGPWGLFIGLFLGHLIDQSLSSQRPRGAGAGPRASLEQIREKFFAATFAVMGHVAKADGRVSEAEIAAARKVMGDLRMSGEQIHSAIGHFTRGKGADFELESTVQDFVAACASEPNLTRVFLEFQVRAALDGVDMQGATRGAVQRVAELLGVSRLELAHMEAVLRIRREQFRQYGSNGGRQQGSGQQAPPKSGMGLAAAYQILEVDPKASNDEVSKAYRRQLSKHHPDKLKANGLPDSMLEHAKQRTQQIIEAHEIVKAERGIK